MPRDAPPGAVRFAHAMGSVVTRRRSLGFAQSSLMVSFGGLLLGVTVIAVLWPRVLAFPLAVLTAWLGAALVINGLRLRHKRARPAAPPTPSGGPPTSVPNER